MADARSSRTRWMDGWMAGIQPHSCIHTSTFGWQSCIQRPGDSRCPWAPNHLVLPGRAFGLLAFLSSGQTKSNSHVVLGVVPSAALPIIITHSPGPCGGACEGGMLGVGAPPWPTCALPTELLTELPTELQPSCCHPHPTQRCTPACMGPAGPSHTWLTVLGTPSRVKFTMQACCVLTAMLNSCRGFGGQRWESLRRFCEEAIVARKRLLRQSTCTCAYTPAPPAPRTHLPGNIELVGLVHPQAVVHGRPPWVKHILDAQQVRQAGLRGGGEECWGLSGSVDDG